MSPARRRACRAGSTMSCGLDVREGAVRVAPDGRGFAGSRLMKARVAILAALGLVLAALALPRDSVYRIRAGKERAVEEGLTGLSDPRYEVRERSFRRLVSLGEASRPALLRALSSENAGARNRASAALRSLDRAAETPIERRTREFRRIVEFGLLRPGGLEPGTSRYAALSLDPGVAARAAVSVAVALAPDLLAHQRTVLLLRRLARPEGAAYLAGLLRDGWWLPSTLHHAAEGLIATGDRSVLPAIREAVDGDDPTARRDAMRVLGHLGEAADVARLRAASDDPDEGTRAVVASALVRLAGADAAPDLARLAADGSAGVRAAAVVGVADLPTVPFRDLASRALADAAPAVRAAGLELLRRRGEERDAETARALLDDPDAAVRGEAVRTLAVLGLTRKAVESGLADASPAVMRVALLAARQLPEEVRKEVLLAVPAPSDPFLASLRKSVLATN